jgi:3-(3-hydroxy-phenyl)propionate hydroxylase
MSPGEPPLPVVVVGAGPVGMATALGLARRGIPVTVLEAAEHVSFGSRAICLSRHSLEVAERLGFAGPVEAVALPWTGGRSYFRDTEVLQFRMPMGEHDVRPPMVNIGQCQLEQLMVDRVLDEPLVRLLWRAEVTGFADDGADVTLDVATADGPVRLRAAWVVAADGGRSRMRELAGLTLAGTSYEGRYVIADIHWPVDLPVERRVWFDPPSNPGSTVLMHRQPDDIWRIDYQLDPEADVDAELRADRIRERVARHLAWLGSEVPWTLEWHGLYMAHARALDRFVHGRVAFAGDAAHLVPIFGVRGLNSGLEDAETLAWMLAAVVGGRADPAILDAYAVERRSAWEQNVANAAKSTRFMTPGTDGHRVTREAILRLAAAYPAFGFLLNPRQASATHAHTSPLTWHADAQARGTLPGDPVPDWSVVVGEAATTLNRLRGNGFGLLAFGLDDAAYAAVTAAGERLAAALAPEECRLVLVNGAVSVAAQPVVVDPAMQQALGARDGEVFVVRPDGLLLARLHSTAELDRVAGSVREGRAPEGGRMAPEWPDPTPPAERHLEHLWLSLSRALDEAGPGDREGLLTRLALLLGSLVPINRLSSAIAGAVDLGRDGDAPVGQ